MRKRSLVIVATMILVLALATAAMAADPFVGTWELNVAKSKVSDPTMMPKSEIVKNEAIDNGLKSTLDGVSSEGKAYHMELSVKYDGKDYPIAGFPTVDTFAQKKIDANSYELVEKKAGKEVGRWLNTASKDGKTSTLTGKGTNAKGREYNATWVYDKQ